MSQKETKPRKKGISLVNWLGTLLLSALPGINVIAWVLFCIFGKNRSKRTFAAAALIHNLVVSLVDLFHFVAGKICKWVALVIVGVIFPRQLPIRSLYLVIARIWRYAQHAIRVGHRANSFFD